VFKIFSIGKNSVRKAIHRYENQKRSGKNSLMENEFEKRELKFTCRCL